MDRQRLCRFTCHQGVPLETQRGVKEGGGGGCGHGVAVAQVGDVEVAGQPVAGPPQQLGAPQGNSHRDDALASCPQPAHGTSDVGSLSCPDNRLEDRKFAMLRTEW